MLLPSVAIEMRIDAITNARLGSEAKVSVRVRRVTVGTSPVVVAENTGG